MMMCHNAADFPQGRAWIELDRSALLHNVRVLRALLPERSELMPAVKAKPTVTERRWSPASFREQVSDLSRGIRRRRR